MFKDRILENFIKALEKAVENNKLGELKEAKFDGLTIEKPKNADFGDFAINVSPLARTARMAPPRIAEAIVEYLSIEDVEINIVGGFINFKVGRSWLNTVVKDIIKQANNYGRNNIGNNEKVLLEYVSANPTGPLHIGHGRWAAMGSALANLMNFSGYKVDQEFYINDAGGQITNLARSLWIRILQQIGINAEIPTEGDEAKSYYPGEYLIETAQEYLKDNKAKVEKLYANNPDPYNPSNEVLTEMATYAKAQLLQQQKNLLETLRVNFDTYYSETSLHESGKVEQCVNVLKEKNEIYEKDGAVWFKSSKYGDDQDRVIKKKDGSNTYLTADIAYHYDKLQRGYDRLINIWGADHHGYVARMKAALEALGFDSNKLEVLLGQLVNLIISGEQVRMGKRKKMITLEDLVNDVGVDATRYWMIMRSIDTTLDFDVDLAKSNTDENPVFYVQYAHARACSILRNAVATRLNQDTQEILPPYFTHEQLEEIISADKFNIDINALWDEKDEKSLNATKTLLLKLEAFQDTVQTAARCRTPYIIARYVQELAGDFHHFYTFSRVLNVEESIMKARLALVAATKQVIFNGLNLLGVSAPEKM